jgi:hypothetical protein
VAGAELDRWRAAARVSVNARRPAPLRELPPCRGSGWIATVSKTLVLGVLDGVVVAVVVLLTTLVALLGT